METASMRARGGAVLYSQGGKYVEAEQSSSSAFDLVAQDGIPIRVLVSRAASFKEGDILDSAMQTCGASRQEDDERRAACLQLAQRTVQELLDAPVPSMDRVYTYGVEHVNKHVTSKVASWTFGQLRQFLLDSDGEDIKHVATGLTSDVIAAVTRICTNEQLILISGKLFNPLVDDDGAENDGDSYACSIGKKGFFGARIQPNSPTDNAEDIFWQCMNAFAFGDGDIVIGNNPDDSRPEIIARTESTLFDVVETFGLEKVLPHCCLSHIDTQAQLAKEGTPTGYHFSSIAGTDAANRTFGISVDSIVAHAHDKAMSDAVLPWGLYFETGQGSETTNGAANACDMALLESRKYGMARGVRMAIRDQRSKGAPASHVILNDVSGFLGPEVFSSKEQLIRVCLEDTVMGKLHGLCVGLDICATMHMHISYDELEEAIDAVLPANPAYMMALPTRLDPMLSYLTTSFQDHVRIRDKFGYRINPPMQKFFAETLGVVDAETSAPTERFGDIAWVYHKYACAKAVREGKQAPSESASLAEAETRIAEVRARGVWLSNGHGDMPWLPAPELDANLRQIVSHAKDVLWRSLSEEPQDIGGFAQHFVLRSQSADRAEYINNPKTGEVLDGPSMELVDSIRERLHATMEEISPLPFVQVVVSDGLNACSVEKGSQLADFLESFLHSASGSLDVGSSSTPPALLFCRNARVRLGYAIGERLFANGNADDAACIVHVVGERPGCGHDNFSVYLTCARRSKWSDRCSPVDHCDTRVISGVSATALDPREAGRIAVRLLLEQASDA